MNLGQIENISHIEKKKQQQQYQHQTNNKCIII